MRGARRSLALGASSLLLLSSGAQAQSIEDAFDHPSVSAEPRVRWWWPGAAVDPDEIVREVELLRKNGFAGAEIQSFTPNFVTLTPQERSVVNDYAEPRFFKDVEAAAGAARARGMSLDYTLGSAWPSGGGFAIPPEKALLELAMASTTIKGGTETLIKLAMPARTKRFGALSSLDSRTSDPRAAGWAARLDARAHVVAVVAMRGTAPVLKPAPPAGGLQLTPWRDVITPGTLDPSTSIVLTDRLNADGVLAWTAPPGDWQVFVFKQYASNVGVLGAAGQGPQLILDHMDPTAFAAHAARVGDPLGQHPTGIRSTFVDSLELMQDIPWTERFLAEFRKRRGYDLTPYLPFVVQPGWMQAWNEHYSPPYYDASSGQVGERVRADFRRTVSDLMFDGFLKPFVAWNHSHGIKAKFQAHGGALDILRGYGIADIPETEDLVHGGDPLFMRLARSAADLYGRPVVSAESFVWINRPYDVTPDELRHRADLLFSGGVNSIVAHGLDYRFHATDWPGWHAFQPSAFSGGFSTMLAEANPIWPAVKPLARYIARMQAVLQEGHPIVPVAYFYGRTGYYVGIEDDGRGQQSAEKAFLASGYDFDRINPDSIAKATVRRRDLLSAGGHAYGALVMPPLESIRAETIERVAGFAKAGLRVFFVDRVPGRDDGLADATARDARVRRAVATALRAGARIVPSDGITAAIRTSALTPNLTFASGAQPDLVFVQRLVGSRIVTFIRNAGTTSRDASMILPIRSSVERWDALDGSRTPLTTSVSRDGTLVPLRLGGGESALLVSGPGDRRPVPEARLVERIAIPADGWNLSVIGHVARRPFSSTFASFRLADWSKTPTLASFAGRGLYRRTISVGASLLGSPGTAILDLGEVHDIASVRVNGAQAPLAFTTPFRIDVTKMLHPGENVIEIAVATTPQNAMIDPKAAGLRNLKPVPAGLTGPVFIEVMRP